MKKSLIFLLVVFSIYTPLFYLFFDNAEERVEHATMAEIVPFFMVKPITSERIEQTVFNLERMGVNTNTGLYKKLKSNNAVSDITITTNAQKGNIKEVILSFNIGQHKVQSSFWVVDKELFRFEPKPSSFILVTGDSFCVQKDGKKTFLDIEKLMKVIFATKESYLSYYINTECGQYDQVLQQETENDQNTDSVDLCVENKINEFRSVEGDEKIIRQDVLNEWETECKSEL